MNVNNMKCSLESLVLSGQMMIASDTDKGMFDRIKNMELSFEDHVKMRDCVKCVGVTDEFVKVVRLFGTEEGQTPAGFRHELVYGTDGTMRVDLVRDISFGANGIRRPTNVLYSANTANPFAVMTMKDLIANLTTNPQIIYDQFLNNPKANVGGQFKDRYEVLAELGRIVGPGVDISVEFNDPFAEESALMEEVARFEEILTPYRLVVKVPHTGPLNRDNVGDFLNGTYPAYDTGVAEDCFYGHNLAYRLHEKGYRVNFTLMAEPHQTALALLAKPYFINAFVERRHSQTLGLATILECLNQTGDPMYREQLHDYMRKADMLASNDTDYEAAEKKARMIVAYRDLTSHDGHDGLDSVRHSLRVLKGANLPDTRLIICNTKSAQMYYDIDKLVVEPEFADMKQRIILTCEPDYFAQFTGSPTVYCYQRSFLNSVK